MSKHRKEPVKCPICKGDGYTTYNRDNQQVIVPCVGCNGTGKQP